MLLISSYSLEKADVNYRAGVLCALELNYRAGALCALELNCCAGSKLPGGSPRRCSFQRCTFADASRLAHASLVAHALLVAHAKGDETVSNLISQISWHRESDPGPPHYQCDALPTEPCQHILFRPFRAASDAFLCQTQKEYYHSAGPLASQKQKLICTSFR